MILRTHFRIRDRVKFYNAKDPLVSTLDAV